MSWEEGGVVAAPRPFPPRPLVDSAAIEDVAAAVRGGKSTLLLLGGGALGERGLLAASRVAAATGARLLVETFPPRLDAGAGRPAIDRLAYLGRGRPATTRLGGHAGPRGSLGAGDLLRLPGSPSDLVPAGCRVVRLADHAQDVADALERLAAQVAEGVEPVLAQATRRPPRPSEALDVNNFASAVAATLPDGAIVVDESNTSGFTLGPTLATAARHTLLTLTGGAIGQGLPVATGAAIAAPDRPVLSLEADGSAMYTIQALWTQVREHLDVTTVVLNNSAYAILRLELMRTGAGSAAGPRSARMLDLSDPGLDFVAIANGMGMSAQRVSRADDLAAALRDAYASPGPHLIEAVIPPIV